MFLTAILTTLVAVTQAATPEVLLEEAKQAYIAGDPDLARELFTGVLALGPSLPAEVRREAMAYLGDLLFSEEGPEASRNVFDSLLDEAPDYTLDAFDHPPEVVAYFESIKAAQAPAPRIVPPLEPWPAMVAVPAGVYYYTVGKPGVALLVGVGQVGGAVGSWVTFARAREMSACLRNEPPDCDGVDASSGRYVRVRTLNWALFALGTSAYLGPLVVETARWGATTSVTLGVGLDGVRLAGSF